MQPGSQMLRWRVQLCACRKVEIRLLHTFKVQQGCDIFSFHVLGIDAQEVRQKRVARGPIGVPAKQQPSLLRIAA